MKRQKIIIICPSMWPKMSMWGETQRMFYLANYLAGQGYEIIVISPAYETNRKISDAREQRYRNIYLGTIKRTGKPGQAVTTLTRDGILRKIKRQISGMANRYGEWFYGEQDITEVHKKSSWVRKYRDKICQIIKEERADTVIISMPGFTFMKLGPIIRNACANVKLIYDYRDPWHLWRYKKNPAYYREKLYLGYADCIVGFSEMFRTDMIQTMKLDPNKIYTVYNGYSEQAWQKFEKTQKTVSDNSRSVPDHKMIMTYTGNMSLANKKSNYRNPANLIAVIKEIPDIELYLVGVSKVEKGVDEKNIHFIGEVTQQQSFLYMSQSDVLISIHDTSDRSGEYLISGKFYDYMRSGKTILHIGSDNGLMAEFVNKYGLGVVCENQTEKLRGKINALMEKWKAGRLIRITDDEQNIKQFERDTQNEMYKQIIDNVHK